MPATAPNQYASSIHDSHSFARWTVHPSSCAAKRSRSWARTVSVDGTIFILFPIRTVSRLDARATRYTTTDVSSGRSQWPLDSHGRTRTRRTHRYALYRYRAPGRRHKLTPRFAFPSPWMDEGTPRAGWSRFRRSLDQAITGTRIPDYGDRTTESRSIARPPGAQPVPHGHHTGRISRAAGPSIGPTRALPACLTSAVIRQ